VEGDAMNNANGEVLSQFERSVEEYNAVLAQARIHKDQINKDRAALGVLHTRLTGMRDQVRRWRSTLWKSELRESVNLDNRTDKLLRMHETLLDSIIWKLFEFREDPNTNDQT
jgi:hypothetical protein